LTLNSASELIVVQKMNETFYKARDAIENGSYLKASVRTLRRYHAELKRPQPWENDPKAAFAVSMKAGWIAKVDKEIENRKKRRKATFRRFLLGILITVIGGLILGLFFLFLSHILANHNIPNKRLPLQSLHLQKPKQPQESPIQPLLSPKNESNTDTKPAQPVTARDR
jgi:hypothetical protein